MAKNKNQIEIWHSEYELRRFIDTATRWSIEAIYNTTDEKYLRKDDFDLIQAFINYDQFRNQLKNWSAGLQYTWSFEEINNTRSSKNPFGMFDFDVKNAPLNYENFCAQLNQKLGKTKNWKAIELDLKQRFLPMIELYLVWHKLNETELEKFKPYSPYDIMKIIIERTKNEILKYFPEEAEPK